MGVGVERKGPPRWLVRSGPMMRFGLAADRTKKNEIHVIGFCSPVNPISSRLLAGESRVRNPHEILVELATRLTPADMALVAELMSTIRTPSVHHPRTPSTAYERHLEWNKLYRRRKRLERKQTMSLDTSGVHHPRTPSVAENDHTYLEHSIDNTQSKKVRKNAIQGSRLDSTLELPEEWLRFATTEGILLPEVLEIFKEFKDYWCSVPGARARKVDWFATWRNNIRRVLSNRKGNGHGRGRKNIIDECRELAEQARELERAAGIGRPPDDFGSH